MTTPTDTRMPDGPRPSSGDLGWATRWRRWPAWAPYAAAVWGVLYAAVQVTWVMTGTALPLGANRSLPSVVQLILAGLAILAAAACLAGARVRGGPGRMAVRASMAVVIPVFVLGTFGAPIEFVSLIAGAGVGSSGAGLAHLLLDIPGAGLLVVTGLSFRRRLRGRCPRCGRAHPGDVDGPLTHPAASTASVGVRVAVYAGMCGILPWAITKTIWTMGGDALGVTARQWRETGAGGSGLTKALASVGIDFTVLAAMLAWFLMLGLVYPWGQVFPRWTLVLSGRRVPRLLPLIPAWLTGTTLALYGTALTVAAAVMLVAGVGTGSGPSSTAVGGGPELSTWMIEFGGLAFAGLGIGLVVAARSYAARTRPVCAAAGTPATAAAG
ncbi:hypothetical protein ACQPYK_12910 [Streptosporangium sp. CA-135522]|uniref:hypothetical protein n=1 Tax=Streptosporangium sp. CA-135522 TaxID=3240072 RepID=UPI003D8E39A6